VPEKTAMLLNRSSRGRIAAARGEKMRIQPDGANLLDTVATVLRDQILPTVPQEQQYTLRMAINAIGIAGRQLANGDEAERELQARVVQLLGGDAGDHPDRLLANKVRDGSVAHDATLRELLWRVTEQRVRESAPRYLTQEGL
jgi:hypothetical protein